MRPDHDRQNLKDYKIVVASPVLDPYAIDA